MEDFIEYLSDPAFLLSLAALLVLVTTIYMIASNILDQVDLENRMNRLANERERLRDERRTGGKANSLRSEGAGWFGEFEKKLELAKFLEDPNLEDKLSRAGFREKKAISYYYFARFSLMIGLGTVGFIWAFVMGGMTDMTLQMRLLALAIAICMGYYLPSLFLQNTAAKRQKEISKVFPDALDMTLICVESGMSVEVALGKVGQEIGTASTALAEELTRTVAELAYLPSRRMAYENLAKRTGHEGIKAVTLGLIQAELYGTPVGEVLRVMAKENRTLRMTAAEKKAAALPAKLTVPMILFFLPVLFIVVGGPAYIQVMETWQ